jgi:L-amino acid N-acyltransferase YncA
MEIRDAVDRDLPAIIDIYNAAATTRIATAQLEPVTFVAAPSAIKPIPPPGFRCCAL